MTNAEKKPNLTGKWAMWACCTIMVVPLVSYLVVAQTSITTAGLVNSAIPLVLCLGMHLVMHKMMGKSCHDKPTRNSTTEQNDAI